MHGVAWCASCRQPGLELMPPTWYTVFPQLCMEVVAKGREGKGCDFKLYLKWKQPLATYLLGAVLAPLSKEGHQQRYFLEKLCHSDLILCGFSTEPRVTGVRLLGNPCRRQVQSQHNQIGNTLHIGVIV